MLSMKFDAAYQVTNPLYELLGGFQFVLRVKVLCSTSVPNQSGLQQSEKEGLASIAVSHVREEYGSLSRVRVLPLLIIEFIADKVLAPFLPNCSSKVCIVERLTIV